MDRNHGRAEATDEDDQRDDDGPSFQERERRRSGPVAKAHSRGRGAAVR
jgi:hypothetical protein